MLLREDALSEFGPPLDRLKPSETYRWKNLKPFWDRVSPAAIAAVVGLDCKEREKLILALIKDRFDDDPRAVSRFQEFCQAHEIKVNFSSWG